MCIRDRYIITNKQPIKEQHVTTIETPMTTDEHMTNENVANESNDSKEEKVTEIRDRAQINHELELKYNRNRYVILVHGENIADFSANVFDRLSELKRCTGVSNPKLILPIIDEDSETTSLKIAVDNYKDYMNLLGPWPSNAFKGGVKIEPQPPNLSIVINNVDNDLSGGKCLRNTENLYEISGMERIYTGDGRTTKKLKAQANSIVAFINILKGGIYLDITSKKHEVTPNIMYARVCKQCGKLNHREKECKNKTHCLKCGEEPHKADCKPKCINCSGPHQCNSELCNMLVEKTFELNKVVLDILIGENIICLLYTSYIQNFI